MVGMTVESLTVESLTVESLTVETLMIELLMVSTELFTAVFELLSVTELNSLQLNRLRCYTHWLFDLCPSRPPY